MVRVIYTRHLRIRLETRKIPEGLPRMVFEESDRKYRDRETGHLIAIKRVRLRGRERTVMVAYDLIGDGVEIVTIHPISEDQEVSRAKVGRWSRIG